MHVVGAWHAASIGSQDEAAFSGASVDRTDSDVFLVMSEPLYFVCLFHSSHPLQYHWVLVSDVWAVPLTCFAGKFFLLAAPS